MRTFVSMAVAAAVAAGMSLGIQSAHALTLSFFNITNNSDVDVAGQLSVLVGQDGDDVSFKFVNDVGIDSSVTSVYFDDAIPLLGDATIFTSGTDVNFSESSGNLPGGAPHSFSATYTADADAPPPHNGLNEDTDWLTIVFDLLTGWTFADVTAALVSGELRIGMHVQSIAGTTFGSDSDSFLNNPPIRSPCLLASCCSSAA
jgi:hypothetical protein